MVSFTQVSLDSRKQSVCCPSQMREVTKETLSSIRRVPVPKGSCPVACGTNILQFDAAEQPLWSAISLTKLQSRASWAKNSSPTSPLCLWLSLRIFLPSGTPGRRNCLPGATQLRSGGQGLHFGDWGSRRIPPSLPYLLHGTCDRARGG